MSRPTGTTSLASPATASVRSPRTVMHPPDSPGTELLCTLRRGNAGAPLFLVPSVGSTPLSLVRLARSIPPPRPVHAFSYAGIEDDRPPHATLAAMAAEYLVELRALAPQGPYLLGGHCLGGVVALEMALQLEACGEVVARLAVMDSIVPGLGDAGDTTPHRDERGAVAATIAEPLRRVFDALVARTVEHYPLLEPDDFERLRAAMRLHIDAALAYRPRRLRARIHLLRTDECDASLVAEWTSIAASGLVEHRIPGDTLSMLRPPHVEAVGRVLGGVLEGLA